MEETLKVVDTDRYGRTVAAILRGSQNINLQMVRRGQAFAYRQHLGNRDASTYLGAKRRAEVDRLGVWSTPGGSQRRRRTAPAATALPDGRRCRCSEFGSYGRAQELLRQGHTNLDSNGEGGHQLISPPPSR
jgi:hypothetical protein